MFQKPFRTKNNVQLKSSDRKKLQSRLIASFYGGVGGGGCTETDVQLLLPSKASVSQLKIITHSEEICTVYAVDRVPMFFETPTDPNVLLPTVYAMWLVPDLVPAFTTHPEVLPRLAKGANLMLPGVIRQGSGQSAYGHLRRDAVVAVNLTSNRAAVGVGLLARSSSDLFMCGGVGVCVNMVHVFGDKLWSLDGAQCQQVPSLGPVTRAPNLVSDFPTLGGEPSKKQTPVNAEPNAVKYQAPKEHFPALGGEKKVASKVQTAAEQPKPSLADGLKTLQVKESATFAAAVEASGSDDDDDDGSSESETDCPPTATVDEADVVATAAATDDEILRRAFLTTLKLDGRKLPLPMLTSTFYRCHVVPAAERPIDLKRTVYKKLGKFLAEMAAERYVTLQEEQKGVEKIVDINVDHPELVEFVAHVKSRAAADDAGAQLFVTEMTELYLVTDVTAKFWARFDLANGQGAEKSALKRMLKEYVSQNKLQVPKMTNMVACNEMLASLLGVVRTPGEAPLVVEFDRLFASILAQMKHSFEMRQRNEIKSSKNPSIQLQLAKRSGNKMVTLVNNLEAFGIRLAEFEKACKIGVAASTSVTKLASQKGEQLLVQGNQIKFVTKLLTETYKIPAKSIVGVELAKKDKKATKKH